MKTRIKTTWCAVRQAFSPFRMCMAVGGSTRCIHDFVPAESVIPESTIEDPDVVSIISRLCWSPALSTIQWQVADSEFQRRRANPF